MINSNQSQKTLKGTPEDLALAIQLETMSKLAELMKQVELEFHTSVLDIEEVTRDRVARLVDQARNCGIQGYKLARFHETEFNGTIGSDFSQAYAPLAERFNKTLEEMTAAKAIKN